MQHPSTSKIGIALLLTLMVFILLPAKTTWAGPLWQTVPTIRPTSTPTHPQPPEATPGHNQPDTATPVLHLATHTKTPSRTATKTASLTPSQTETLTPTASPTVTATVTFTATSSITPTPIPARQTGTPWAVPVGVIAVIVLGAAGYYGYKRLPKKPAA